MKTVKYGLRHKAKGKVLGYSTQSNEGSDFCVSVSVSLDLYSNSQWLVDDPRNAEYVRHNSTSWFNADDMTPNHDFDADELEVVKVEVEVKVDAVEVNIPTYPEWAKEMYAESEPAHYKNLLEYHAKDKYSKVHYSLHDLKRFDDKVKKKGTA